MSASLRIELSLSKIINPKLEVEYCKYQSDLKAKNKKSSGTIFSHPVLCCSLLPQLRILLWQESIQWPHLTRLPVLTFILYWDCFGLKCYVQGHGRNAKSEPNSTRKEGLIKALFFILSQPKFARLRSSFNAFTARTADGCIFEVKLSITKRSNWRSEAMVKMS